MPRLIRIPDEFSVWAFADPHGVRSGLARALRSAGLIDAAEHWAAGAGVALAGCGDYIDRGGDSSGILDLLFRLRDEAAAAGSLVVLARGNHEAVLAKVLAGNADACATWLYDAFGGRQSALSFGLPARLTGRPAAEIAAALVAAQPTLGARLAAMPEAILWRDVLLCHAGPVAGFGPHDLGLRTTEHLWQFPSFERDDLPEWDVRGPAYGAYHAAGLRRFVYGHESHDGPAIFAGGLVVCLDTHAGAGLLSEIPSAAVTLAHLPTEGAFWGLACAVADTRFAPDLSPIVEA